MFKKLHVHLTLFFTGVTGLIVVLMTVLSLYLSEHGLLQTNYVTFLNSMNMIMSYLENQDVVTQEWLAKQEQHGTFLISVYDNGQEFYMSELAHSQAQKAVLAQALSLAQTEHGYSMDTGSRSRLSSHVEFSMEDENRIGYYVSAMTLQKEQGVLHALVLYSRFGEHAHIMQQRLTFALLDLGSILVIALFCWIFTRHLLRPLEENRRQQAQFIASASHELRSPLSVILSSASALERVPASSQDTHRFLEAIHSEGDRMAALVNEMLTLANSDAHTWKIKKVPTQLDTLLLDTYEKYEILSARHQIHLSVELPESELPNCLCDSVRITQVLSILLDNALRYTPEGGQIILRLLYTGDSGFQLRVADSGPGIPVEQRALIFGRFYRGDSSRSDRSHFGLGLCIAQEILLLHKGSIRVEEASIGGAEFVVILP
ncbi:MAG: HAMP domain-containing sensor histidine kinase [Lachnospiraceae bacterium]|nr:HAMP domain-containing sensor histidine kinase [Lachnospiraceae bacterium]